MHLFFDLDGTLTDSRPGIIRSFAHALEQVGCPGRELPVAVCIGPPLPLAFETLLGTDDADLVERAIAAYRQRFASVGIFENTLYPGVRQTLMVLHEAGHRMRLVTAKPAPYATRVLRHFGIEHFFDGLHGPSLEDRAHNKAGLVAQALSAIGSADAVMIGDRAEDIRAARANRIRSIAAGWGYGSIEELSGAGADHRAEGITEVPSVVARWSMAGV